MALDEPRQSSFARYYKIVLRQVAADLKHDLKSTVAAIISAIVVAVLMQKYHLITPDQTWTRAIINATPAIVLLLAYLVYHAVRAPWRINNQTAMAFRLSLDKQDAIRKEMEANHDETTQLLERTGEQTRTQIDELKVSLTKEREDLSRCPQITLRRTLPFDKFLVHNSGTDALSVQLRPLETAQHTLTSRVIPYLSAGETVPLSIHAQRRNSSELEGDDIGAWILVCHDVSNSGTEPVLRLTLTYADLSGRRYESSAQVAFDLRRPSVVEIRPEPITRIPS